MINCMIAGVGGQGTVLASKLIAATALEKGMDVRTTETIGMAQRGGAVVSHIRMGHDINSPLIPLNTADIIIAFEPAEGVRLIPFINKNGLMIVCDTAIKPVSSFLLKTNYEADSMIDYLCTSVSNLFVVSGKVLMSRCANIKSLNVALLGFAVQSGRFPFDINDMSNTIKDKIPERFMEMNLVALDVGKELYNETIKSD